MTEFENSSAVFLSSSSRACLHIFV